MPLFNKKQLNTLVSGSHSEAKAVLFSAGIRRSDGSPSASWGGFAAACEALENREEALQLAQTALVVATESGSRRGKLKIQNLIDRIKNPPATGKKADAVPATPRFTFSFQKVEAKAASAKKPPAKTSRRTPAAKAKPAAKAAPKATKTASSKEDAIKALTAQLVAGSIDAATFAMAVGALK